MDFITKDDVELFFTDLNELLKNNNYVQMKDDIKTFFNTARSCYTKENFIDIIGGTSFNKFQKDIIISAFDNGSDIVDFLGLKIAGFSIDKKNEEILNTFEDLIFTKSFYDLVNKKTDDFDFKNDYLDSILFIRNNILPNTNLETVAKFYVYIASENLHNDLSNDECFRDLCKTNPSDFKSVMIDKIATHLEFWKMSRDHSNDLNFTISREYPNYAFFGWPHSIDKIVTKNAPAGFLDVVMRSPNKQNIYIARANNNLIQNDLFNHLESRLLEERALKAMFQNKEESLILLDFCKGHNKKIIDKFVREDINEDEFLEIKKIFDIILHKAVSEITGLNPIIIQIGDRKYNIEQEEFLDLSLKMTDFMKKDNLNFDNKFVMNILEKTTEWMVTNLIKNKNFYSEVNMEKCNKYLVNVNNISHKHNIKTNRLERELDHLENKLDNVEKSKSRLLVEQEKEIIVARMNYLKKNDVLSYVEQKDMHEFTELRNEIIDNFYNLIFIFQPNDNCFPEETAFSKLQEVQRKGNVQYKIFDRVVEIELITRGKISATLQNKININDPLLKLLYEIKNDIQSFQENYSIDSLKGVKEKYIEFERFTEEKGGIYKYFKNRNEEILNEAFNNIGDFFTSGDCSLSLIINKMDIFIDKMPKKINGLKLMLNKETEDLNKRLKNIDEIRFKMINKEKVDNKDIPNSESRITRLKI